MGEPPVHNFFGQKVLIVMRLEILSVFSLLAILPVSAQEVLPVVDSSKSAVSDRQTPGQVSPSAIAQVSTSATPIPGTALRVPASSFFGGVGIGAAITTFGSQYVYNKGTSDIYKNGVLTSTGVADGPAIPDPYLPTVSNVVPAGQLGYFSKFKGSSWLWGAKLQYAYLGTSSDPQILAIPQYGTSTNRNNSSFSGTSFNTYSIKAGSQFALMPFIGKAFNRGYFYGGAGIGLTQVSTSLNDVVGYATIDGVNTNISGTPQNFSSSQWAYGVAATAGITYFVSSRVFLDLSYTYSLPSTSDLNVSGAPFSNPASNPSDPSYYGTLNGTATSNLQTNVILFTVNARF
jgi:opacity protein-like surface antigen